MSVAEKCIYVGNLPMTATTDRLAQLFSEFGEIRRIQNHWEKGFAFVFFATVESAANVLVQGEIRLDGMVLRVAPSHFGKTTREVREENRQKEDEEMKALRELAKEQGFLDEDETEPQRLRRLEREEHAKQLRINLELQNEKFKQQFGGQSEEPSDEMPVIDKKVKRHDGIGTKPVTAPSAVGTVFRFIEAENKEEVTMRAMNGGAAYEVQGRQKPVFSKASFEEDDDGPFVDFEQLDSSLSLPNEDLIPQLASFFDSCGVKHNLAAKDSREIDESCATGPHFGDNSSSGLSVLHTASGRGRGRGRGQTISTSSQ
ncbi:hypothetical protein DIPPA_70153 [Diplonema papillatum]|nr:hypothetical protein DIPPA_70153 [Diplonema papillatum]